MAEMFVAEGLLETCRAWQEVINSQETVEAKDEAGAEAQKKLREETFEGTRKVIVRGETALFVPDGSDHLEEEIWPVVQFSRIATRGWLGRPNYVRLGENSTLTLPIHDPSVIGLADEIGEMPVMTAEQATDGIDSDLYLVQLDRPLKRTLHFPVGLIDYALCYGR